MDKMGVIDAVRSLLGIRATTDAEKDADPEDLFGMSTAHLRMETEIGYDALNKAGLCFAEVNTADFEVLVKDAESIVESGEEGTVADVTEDSHGYQWVVIEDDQFEDLVVGIHAASDEFIEQGYGSRLLAAVFAFEKDGKEAYWIYSFRRGAYYPFVPDGGRSRDSGAEFKLKSLFEGELEIEGNEKYWYPLWPDKTGGRPWE